MFVTRLTIAILLFGSLGAVCSETHAIRRIQAHLILGDHNSACQEAQEALINSPESRALYEGYLQALARSGAEKKVLEVWKLYCDKFSDYAANRELIEEIAWGILNKASTASSLIMREMSLLAAYFSQDARGVKILHHGMHDANYAIRSIAVKLASNFRDHLLVEDVNRLFREEQVWHVRKHVIEAIGKMHIITLRPELEKLISADYTSAIEKSLAITALVELVDEVNRAEIEQLAYSKRAGLRQLTCRVIAHLNSVRDLDLLIYLTNDMHAHVRSEAFQAIGLLHPEYQINDILTVSRTGTYDINPHTAIAAAWLLTLYAPLEGQQAFSRFLKHECNTIRYLAASALSATGYCGMPLILNQFHEHVDCYVKLNLALGLIGQRVAIQEAADFLKQMLVMHKNRWGLMESGIFSAISHQPKQGTEDSEDENQLLRLELLNLLAILKTDGIQDTIRTYLLERPWSISAVAAALLLMEGDDSAIALVDGLLTDDQSAVRVKAALILSLWSRDEATIRVLEEEYKNSPREVKARILEGIGRIGSSQSIPFLMRVMEEPSQMLRLIAAMSLISCLNS